MSWHFSRALAGGLLGGKILGWRTVGAVEIDGYAREVLKARQDDGCFEAFPIWDDVRSFTKRNNACWRYFRFLRAIRHSLVISGGFPCQDISCAGKGAGIDGKRSGLWGEFERIVGEVRPCYVFVENSPMLTSRGLGRVLGDLAALGYDARWGVLGAVDAGAPHKRERIWILAADTGGERCDDGGDFRKGRHVLHDEVGDAEEGEPEGDGWERGAGAGGAGGGVFRGAEGGRGGEMKACSCWEEMNGKLKEHGMQLSDALLCLQFAPGTLNVAHLVPLQRLDGKRLRSGDPKAVRMSHCPFCGKAYENEEGKK